MKIQFATECEKVFLIVTLWQSRCQMHLSLHMHIFETAKVFSMISQSKSVLDQCLVGFPLRDDQEVVD